MAKRLDKAAMPPLVIDGGSSPKRRRPRKQEISAAQLDTFFETLSDSCNIVLSARAAGFSANWAYRRRQTDAQFRNRWASAVREGYAKLELVLLERALNGTEKVVRAPGGGDMIIREYSNTLAIALLRRHAETVDGIDGLEEEGASDALRAKIIEQLDRLRERDGKKGATAIETKSAAGRLALYRRLLAPTSWMRCA